VGVVEARAFRGPPGRAGIPGIACRGGVAFFVGAMAAAGAIRTAAVINTSFLAALRSGRARVAPPDR
jgi:hypothetical protein